MFIHDMDGSHFVQHSLKERRTLVPIRAIVHIAPFHAISRSHSHRDRNVELFLLSQEVGPF